MSAATIAPGRWLAPAAAASYRRMRAAGMPAGGLNSAGRTTAEQVDIFTARYRPQATGAGPFGDVAWWNGVRYVRVAGPSSAAAPGTSNHEDGLALDVATASAAQAWMLAHGRDHGWRRTILPSEPWHWEYVLMLDRHLTDGTDPIPPLEDDMFEDSDRQLLREVRDGLGVGGGVGLAEALTVLATVRRIEDNTRGLPHALARVHAGTDGVPDVLAALRQEVAAVGTPHLDVDALAAKIAGQLRAITDDELARIAVAVVGEQARRLAS